MFAKKQNFISFKLIIIIFLMSFSISYAQNITLEKITRVSEIILIGMVKHIECKMEKDKNIWTYATIECKEYLKGNKPNELIIRVPGGEVGDLGQSVSGTPNFELNEEVLTFLSKDTNGTYYVNGWDEGKYSYVDGKWIKKDIVYTDNFLSKLKNIITKQSK